MCHNKRQPCVHKRKTSCGGIALGSKFAVHHVIDLNLWNGEMEIIDDASWIAA